MMTGRSLTTKLRGSFLACIILLSLTGLLAVAVPQDDDTSRRFWPPNFRPAPARTAATPKPVRYRRTTPALPKDAIPTETAREAVIGITVWRLRPAKESDDTRILVTKGGKKTNWTPERVEAGMAFPAGQMLRLSIEVPRTGWLYVIDREEYADGTLSDPYLIFPLNPASDANKVTAGRVIELPNQSDDQAFFEVNSLRGAGQPVQVSERLTVLVTPEPLKELPKPTVNAQGEPQPLRLPASKVDEWEKKWGAQTEQLEMENGAGTAWTRAEQAAGASAERQLTSDDPLPQTIIRIAARPGSPLLVRLPLRIAKP
ncbi:MAG TPA: hypothetical protein VFD58_21335 [Blastocatellia bacterium]|nr:hypothetical protein [Blastocatellia bacterium]